MKTLIFVVTCALAGLTWADTTTTVVKVYSLDVKERIQTLELIDVTVEKTAIDEAAEPDLELKAILEEITALEEAE